MVVNSGSASQEHKHAHAYWALTRCLSIKELESTNRRLATALGADPKCADAARILRPPGTSNFKEDPPRPVELAEDSSERYRPIEILTALPVPPSPNLAPAREGRRSGRPSRRDDPLQQIDPPDYVRPSPAGTPHRMARLRAPSIPTIRQASTSTPPPRRAGPATAAQPPTAGPQAATSTTSPHDSGACRPMVATLSSFATTSTTLLASNDEQPTTPDWTRTAGPHTRRDAIGRNCYVSASCSED
jgi:hypothetical protein